ncbi:D-alanine--poly(phosphoribitol) ligase subunit DltA [Streptococcus pneumoniae]|nr:D-alanine--poly(phosphoribitol) ligase subunit DltA [Streptococcus pneumoniae]
MIETIEHFAQTQPSYPVYNVLGQEHTYGDLKADSDSLAAVIDQLGLPEKSPVVVFGGQEYEMLATFVALTKSGHAYIPIDSHSALERVSAILEVAEPSLIIAISAFPLEQVSTPMINLAQVQEAFAQGNNYEITHPVKGDDNYYIIFTSGTTGKPKGVQISHDNLLSFTNWMITDKEFATPSRPQMLAQPPYSFDLSVMYWAPTLALGGTLFTLPSVITQDFKQLFAAIFSLPIAIWTSTPSFADMAMLSEYFNSEKMPGITHFYFDGEELTVKTAQKLRERFPNARIINAYGPTEATVALSAVAVTDEMLATLKRLPIGYTKADSPTFIIDEEGNKLPNGEQGEIIVSGPAVSTGHAYIPIDSHSALERVSAILEVAEPSLIIAISAFPLEQVSTPMINLAQVQEAFAQGNNYEITHPVKGDDNYYIIFTSGTTGKPKGVQISHDNLLSFTNWMITDKEFATPSRPQMLAQPPYSFDLSVMYWAPTLALGGTLFTLPSVITQDFKQLFAAIFSLPIAIWTSTPSFADMAMLSEYFNSEKMPGITHFYFDGEELTVKTAQKLRERFPNARIINAYGPTEATVALSAVAVTDEMLATLKRLPIGYTKADSPTFIIDEEGNKLPNGEQGEIIVSGPAVSKGYMKNPEKTAEAFFEFEGLPAYHTGDVGTMTDEGLLLYGGRMDFQIKFNGYRIELEDVSQNLNKSRFIESAVAVPRYNKDHKVQNLLAYVILKDGVREQFERDIDITKAIKEDLTDIMMSYMMPSKFLYRDSLPLTPNGKIDIKGLINEVNKR